MTTIAVCATLLVLAGIGWLTVRDILRGRLAIARVTAAARIRTPDNTAAPRRVGHRVTVHTNQLSGDLTFFGVISAEYRDRIALEDAELVTTDGPRPLPGRQDIATSDIAWIDVHALVSALPDTAPAEVT